MIMGQPGETSTVIVMQHLSQKLNIFILHPQWLSMQALSGTLILTSKFTNDFILGRKRERVSET